MNLLTYYEQYPLYRRELAVLEGRLRILALDGHGNVEERAELLRRMEEMRQKMGTIRRTLESHTCADPADRREQMRRTDERLFLECRFLQGLTMEQTAEAMCVSRDTAFRIRRRLAGEEIVPEEGACG